MRREDSPTASTTTRLPGSDTLAVNWMSFCWRLMYGLAALVIALTELEMMLMGTSEYTMYLFETLPARKIAPYSRYNEASATQRAMPSILSEPSR